MFISPEALSSRVYSPTDLPEKPGGQWNILPGDPRYAYLNVGFSSPNPVPNLFPALTLYRDTSYSPSTQEKLLPGRYTTFTYPLDENGIVQFQVGATQAIPISPEDLVSAFSGSQPVPCQEELLYQDWVDRKKPTHIKIICPSENVLTWLNNAIDTLASVNGYDPNSVRTALLSGGFELVDGSLYNMRAGGKSIRHGHPLTRMGRLEQFGNEHPIASFLLPVGALATVLALGRWIIRRSVDGLDPNFLPKRKDNGAELPDNPTISISINYASPSQAYETVHNFPPSEIKAALRNLGRFKSLTEPPGTPIGDSGCQPGDFKFAYDGDILYCAVVDGVPWHGRLASREWFRLSQQVVNALPHMTGPVDDLFNIEVSRPYTARERQQVAAEMDLTHAGGRKALDARVVEHKPIDESGVVQRMLTLIEPTELFS